MKIKSTRSRHHSSSFIPLTAYPKHLLLFLFLSLIGCSGNEAAPETARSPAPASHAETVAGSAHESHTGKDTLPELSPDTLAALPPDGGPAYNRLIFEKSPYLLLHATNPVDWYPWGEAAFEKARIEDKPILLSIGYSTCHWCHVMERESFSDPEVAALMNEHFISIKVDREERPDIDNVYMEVTQAMTGQGGWPNTIILTPEREPFFAGTYFPKDSRFGRPGMMELLAQIADAWKSQRDAILESARNAVSVLKDRAEPVSGGAPDAGTLAAAYGQLSDRYDSERGGFGDAPKFPTPHNFYFLLRYWRQTGEPDALAMADKSLRAMRQGGLFDQVGYGFHRYSTDADWVLPHFEKMLYDQALLAIAYLEAYQATGDEFHADVAREIFTYVLRDMTAPEGGFYSAENADSEGEEGRFYLWTLAELNEILGEADGGLAIGYFNAESGGNFHDEAARERTGRNILYPGASLEEKAKVLGIAPDELRARLDGIRKKLLAARAGRVRPLRDDKILTDWNGLMIAALARGGRVLDEPSYTAAAEKAARFVLDTLRKEDGTLLHRYREGEAALHAHLEDYAYTGWALIELYESTFNADYLRDAVALTERQIDDFWDEGGGGFYMTATGSENLIFRPKELYDGAQPSGNSVAALNLLRLGRITANSEWETRAQSIMTVFGQQIAQAPSAHTQLLCALGFGLGPSYEVVVTGAAGAPDTVEMIRALNRAFVPNKVVLFRPEGEDPPIAALAEFTRPQKPLDGKATAYVCQDFACKVPTTDIETMLASLGIDPP